MWIFQIPSRISRSAADSIHGNLDECRKRGPTPMHKDRRVFLTSLVAGIGVSGAGVALVGCSRSASNPGTGPTGKAGAAPGDKDKDDKDDQDDDEVTPAEDLMREHG